MLWCCVHLQGMQGINELDKKCVNAEALIGDLEVQAERDRLNLEKLELRLKKARKEHALLQRKRNRSVLVENAKAAEEAVKVLVENAKVVEEAVKKAQLAADAARKALLEASEDD